MSCHRLIFIKGSSHDREQCWSTGPVGQQRNDMQNYIFTISHLSQGSIACTVWHIEPFIMRRHGSWSTLVYIVACCLTERTHNLKQILTYCQRERLEITFSIHQNIFNFTHKIRLKMLSAKRPWSSTDFKVNSLWHTDARWHHRSGSTLGQLVACCLTAPSHYLKQCWHLLSDILWHSRGGNFTASAQLIILENGFQKSAFKIAAPSARGLWVKPTY